jgi:hypothetical protein
MHRIITSFVYTGLVLSAVATTATLAWSDDFSDSNTSQTSTDETGPGYISTAKVTIDPMVGALVYTDATGSTTTRGMVGLGLTMNAISTVVGRSPVFFGPDTGVFFAHQGSATSDFWGSSPNADYNSAGANLFVIPADFKLAANILDYVQIGAHGGGNVIYRSDLGATTISTNEGTVGSHWGIYPNVGADLDVQLARGVTVTLRPDWTLTSGNKLFSGMLGLNFNIG